MNAALEHFFGNLAGVGITATLFWAFGRDWLIKHLEMRAKDKYDRDLAQFQSDLKHASEMKIADFKSNLEIQANERNIQFSRVFERTAEVVATTYGLLIKTRRAAFVFSNSWANNDADEEAKLAREFDNKRQDFMDYYEPNQIYIPRETRKKIQDFANSLSSLVMTTSMMNKAARMKSQAGFDNTSKKFEELLQKVPDLGAELDEEFQRLLGLIKEKQTTVTTVTTRETAPNIRQA